MISEKKFSNAVYSIDIGQNDITLALGTNLSYQYVVNQIPSIMERIEESIKVSKPIYARVLLLVFSLVLYAFIFQLALQNELTL